MDMPLRCPDMAERAAERSTRFPWSGQLSLCSLMARVGLAVCFLVVGAAGQVPSSPGTPTCSDQVRSTYLLGPGDQLQISAPDELTELANKRVRVDGDGRHPGALCRARPCIRANGAADRTRAQ